MKRILINARQEEEVRVAIVDGQTLLDLNLEIPSLSQKKGSIYKGTVTRVEPSLNATFVEYGGNRNGFLPFKEISSAYFKNDEPSQQQEASGANGRVGVGQQVLVQIQRGERGNKGAALTTRISLAGRYLVFMPNDSKATGVSRRIQGAERDEMRHALNEVEVHDDEGVIIRTAGIGHSKEELNWDLDYLRNLWSSIVAAAKNTSSPALIYEESDIVIRTLRDHFNEEINEIVIDDQQIYNRAIEFTKSLMPQYIDRICFYEKSTPLFVHYQLESKIATMYEREVALPSGGSLVFDHTEALLSIDINSGRATKGQDIEETALAINLEACEEIALQLRMRDVGGLIVIDFIDMRSHQSQRKVENKLSQLIAADPARTQIGNISGFGLLEMSRQRLRPSLDDVSYITCPRCDGNGTIRTLKSNAIAVLRMMEDEAAKDMTARVVAHLPVNVTSFLLNEKRDTVNNISKRYGVKVDIVPDIHMETPHFQISRYRTDDKENAHKASYELKDLRDNHPTRLLQEHERSSASRKKEQAAVGFIMPGKKQFGRSFFSSIWKKWFARKPAVATRTETVRHSNKEGGREDGRESGREGGRESGREGGQRQGRGQRRHSSQHRRRSSSMNAQQRERRQSAQSNRSDKDRLNRSRGGVKEKRYNKDYEDADKNVSNPDSAAPSIPDVTHQQEKEQEPQKPSVPDNESAVQKPSAESKKDTPSPIPRFSRPSNLVQVETRKQDNSPVNGDKREFRR